MIEHVYMEYVEAKKGEILEKKLQQAVHILNQKNKTA